MQIEWYPGHMTKAVRNMEEDIKLIDLVIEICDARIVSSSRNPEVDRIFGGKDRIVLFNKADLADPLVTDEWIAECKKQGIFAAAVDARQKKSLNILNSLIDKATEKKRARDQKRGIRPRPVRTIVVGIPNSGKSTFINSYAGAARAKTGNKPGVTKGKQWIRPNKRLELLDTPGILWPKFEDDSVGMHLACVGSIRDEVFEVRQLVMELMEIVVSEYPDSLKDTYSITETGAEFLEVFADSRHIIKKGGEPDYDRVCHMLLTDFRSGKWGRISLERLQRS